MAEAWLEAPGAPRHTVPKFLSSAESLKPSGHFRLDLPPEFAHSANRPRYPGLR
jgi:hypothetical protein